MGLEPFMEKIEPLEVGTKIQILTPPNRWSKKNVVRTAEVFFDDNLNRKVLAIKRSMGLLWIPHFDVEGFVD